MSRYWCAWAAGAVGLALCVLAAGEARSQGAQTVIKDFAAAIFEPDVWDVKVGKKHLTDYKCKNHEGCQFLLSYSSGCVFGADAEGGVCGGGAWDAAPFQFGDLEAWFCEDGARVQATDTLLFVDPKCSVGED